MGQASEPTIRGIFVMSHINTLEEQKGHDGIVELLTRYGKPIRFGALENVPVREEVAIIEHTLDILTNNSIPHERRAFEDDGDKVQAEWNVGLCRFKANALNMQSVFRDECGVETGHVSLPRTSSLTEPLMHYHPTSGERAREDMHACVFCGDC